MDVMKGIEMNPDASRGATNIGVLQQYSNAPLQNRPSTVPAGGYGQSSANVSNQVTAPSFAQTGTGKPETQANRQAVASGLSQYAPILSFGGEAITGEIQKKGNYVYAPNAQGGYNAVDTRFVNPKSNKSIQEQFQAIPPSTPKAFAVPPDQVQSWVNNPKPTTYTYNHTRDARPTTEEAWRTVLQNPLSQSSVNTGGTPTYIEQVLSVAGYPTGANALAELISNPGTAFAKLTAASNQVVKAPGTITTQKGKGTQGFTPYNEYRARYAGEPVDAETTSEGSRLRSEGLLGNLVGLPVPLTTFQRAGRAAAAAGSSRPSTALALTQGAPSTALARTSQAVQTAPNWINYADDAAGRAGVLNLGMGPLNPQYATQVANMGTNAMRGISMAGSFANQYTPRLVPDVELNQVTTPVIPGVTDMATVDVRQGEAEMPRIQVPSGFLPSAPPAPPAGVPKAAPQLNIEEVQGDTINVPKVSWMQAIPALASMASARVARNALADLQAPQAPRTTMVPQFEYESNIGQALQDVRNATIAQSRNTMLSSGQAAALRQGMLAERFNQEARLRSADQQQRQQAQQSYQALSTNVRIANDNLRNEYIKDSVAFANERKMMDANLRIAPLNTLSASVSDYLKNIYQPGLANALYAANRPYDTQYTTETTAE